MKDSYVGKLIDLVEAVNTSEFIVVAKFLDLGLVEPGAPGQSYYNGAKIRVMQSLSKETYGEEEISFTVQRFPENEAEQEPRIGDTRILFIQTTGPQAFRAIKMMPDSENNVKEVQELLT